MRAADARFLCGAALFVSLVGALGWALSAIDRAVCPAPPRPAATPAFVLCAAHPAPRPRAHRLPSRDLLGAAVMSLSGAQREGLADVLTAVNARLLALENPLFVSLDDEDPDAPLGAWLKRGPASLSVAGAAALDVGCATDGLCARIEPRACPTGWEEPREPRLRERARFLVWAWGYALRVRCPSAARARELAASLRESARETRHIGLVLHADDATAMDVVAPRLVHEWKRHEVLTALHHDEAERRDEADDARAMLDALDVLVLPRLESILEPLLFRAEVRRLSAGATVTEAVP